MKKVNGDWAKSQLEALRVPFEVGDSVVKLLNVWNSLEHQDSNNEKILDIFTSLAQSKALIESSNDEIWEPASPGFVRVGDEVRVMADAYEGEVGQIHNGRRGRVVAVRYGDIILKTTDGKEPTIDGSHHSPWKLEKLVAVL